MVFFRASSRLLNNVSQTEFCQLKNKNQWEKKSIITLCLSQKRQRAELDGMPWSMREEAKWQFFIMREFPPFLSLCRKVKWISRPQSFCIPTLLHLEKSLFTPIICKTNNDCAVWFRAWYNWWGVVASFCLQRDTHTERYNTLINKPNVIVLYISCR